MIKVFGQTDTSFVSNGDVVLLPLKAKVHKEDNGDYYLDLETGLEYIDYLTEGNIVVANTPQGEQAFRIGNVQKTKSGLLCVWLISAEPGEPTGLYVDETLHRDFPG